MAWASRLRPPALLALAPRAGLAVPAAALTAGALGLGTAWMALYDLCLPGPR